MPMKGTLPRSYLEGGLYDGQLAAEVTHATVSILKTAWHHAPAYSTETPAPIPVNSEVTSLPRARSNPLLQPRYRQTCRPLDIAPVAPLPVC